jgi:predicted peroxiredoxin
MFCNSGRGRKMDYDLHIGHSGDTLNLLNQVLEEKELDPDVEKILEAVRDAIERGIV